MGYRPKHPIVIVPGFVTSGLELWHGKPCANRFFRCAVHCANAMFQGPDCALWALMACSQHLYCLCFFYDTLPALAKELLAALRLLAFKNTVSWWH